MKKIAITTLVGCLNYGNRLQMYALQHLVKETLDADVYTFSHDSFLNTAPQSASLSRRIVSKILRKKSRQEKLKEQNYDYFDKNINFDNFLYTESDLNSLNNKYDFFITGSDQVFNSEMNLDIFSHTLSGIDGKKKVSYAASLGKNSLTDFEKALFKKELSSFKAISVRESQSVDVLKNILKIPVYCHADPTLCVSKDEWQKLERKPKGLKEKDYIFVYILGNKTEEYKNFIEKLSKENGLEVVDLADKKSKYYSSGPAEFLYLIRNSSLVLTDSFHAIVFSIIFKKPFLHMQRQDDLTDMSIRITNLEKLFNTKFETLRDYDKLKLFEFKLVGTEKVLEKEKQRSIKYLKEMFIGSKPENNLKDKDFNCAGCGLCANICPKGAITYITNEKGFIKPVIDEEKCVHCGLCKNNCPELKTFKKLDFKKGIYAYKNKELKVSNSSTIGLVNQIAEKIIDDGGVVFGVPYSKNSSRFIKAETLADLEKLKGSKYYQADITNVYKEIEKELSKNRKVMVTATPCQIAGIHGKFGANSNLILVQVICHGVPPYALFQQTAKETYGTLPDDVNFKFHEPSWDNYSVKYNFGSDEKLILFTEEKWLKIYLNNVALNDCCYTCNFAGSSTGADIIIGDCWGIWNISKKFYDKKGVSILSPVTDKGIEVLNSVKANYAEYKIPKSKYKFCNENLFKCANKKSDYAKQLEFFEKLKNEKSINKVFEATLKKTAEEELSTKQKLKRKIKNIIKKIIRY